MTTLALSTSPEVLRLSAAPTHFTAEVELGPAVCAWLAAGSDVAAVVEELDAGTGVADVVAAHLAHPHLPRRRAIADPLQLRLLELTQNPVPEAVLRDWAPHGWRSLRHRVIELVHDGYLAVEPATKDGGDPTYLATVDVSEPYSHLTAVELKLRDWRRAIAQAGRYRLWAERSFVAIPADRVTDGVVAKAEWNRVGILAVGGSAASAWVTVVLDSPTASVLQPQRRRWAAERVLAQVREPSLRRAGAPIR
jgi:hypothetical protein